MNHNTDEDDTKDVDLDDNHTLTTPVNTPERDLDGTSDIKYGKKQQGSNTPLVLNRLLGEALSKTYEQEINREVDDESIYKELTSMIDEDVVEQQLYNNTLGSSLPKDTEELE